MSIAHLAVFDTLADWEVGHLLVELRTARFTSSAFEIVTVAETTEPIVTMGGVRYLPDACIADVDPADSDLLILPGGELWDAGGGEAFTAAARRWLDAGVPVAAICGATFGLARAGLLDERRHTSNAREYLRASGYRGGALYRDEPAVTDRDLITASGVMPVDFARAIFARLELLSPNALDAWYGLYKTGEARYFHALAASASPAPT